MSDARVTYRTLEPQELEVLVVFTCYQAADLTVDCLRSMADQIRDVPKMKVAICENGTGPEAVHTLRDAIQREGWSDWVMLKAIEPNRGFTGGNNAILREAMAWPQPPRYFVLLNTDTLVRPGALRRLYDAMEADPGIGILGPRMISAEGEPQLSCFLDPSPVTEFLRAANTGLINRLLRRNPAPLAAPTERIDHDWVTFACAMIRREVLHGIGLLDEGFFLYFDDPDYCRSARRAGWRIAHCADAEVMHLEGASNPVPSDTRARRRRPRYYYVSRARYFGKHRGRAVLWLGNMAWLAGRLISWTRERFGRKAPHVCEREGSDLWVNALSPVRLSEPRHRPL
jgi:GT2 family glycosyltransferase